VLRELHITNYALIKNLTLPFGEKLNVLTGETGAGKSIIIGALNLVLGGRANTSDVRTGTQSASVEAVFDIKKNGKLKKTLSRLGVESENNVLILRRMVNQKLSGRNYINDKPVTLKSMKQVGDELIDIHGQHEHQSLLRIDKHIDYLDNFLKLKKKREELSRLFVGFLKKEGELVVRKKRIKELKEKEELLRFQTKEIDDAQLNPGEDDELEQRQRILENAERLIQTVKDSFEELYQKEESIFEIISRIKTNIEPLCRIDNSLEKGKEQLDNILFGVMKYGKTINEIKEYGDSKEKEIKELEDISIETEEIEKDIKSIKEMLIVSSYALSEERIKGKQELEKKVKRELKELGMDTSKFCTEVIRLEDKDGLVFPDGKRYKITDKGIDRVSFLISTNPGEPVMPLRKVVSGGELSRIMLALKSILSSLDEVYCMIFDEVDSGIGGTIAETVGNKMKKISRERQVITITHLHQIASKGDFHIKVRKEEKDGRTYTYAKPLKEEEKIEEVARLISGEKLSKTALEHARTILKKGNKKNQ
jgi:DNA repair protein RecN (Recombination protein N)